MLLMFRGLGCYYDVFVGVWDRGLMVGIPWIWSLTLVFLLLCIYLDT
jgi:hypothetical protein